VNCRCSIKLFGALLVHPLGEKEENVYKTGRAMRKKDADGCAGVKRKSRYSASPSLKAASQRAV